jgi:hypothetical protein
VNSVLNLRVPQNAGIVGGKARGKEVTKKINTKVGG